jgi:hypothetical protein
LRSEWSAAYYGLAWQVVTRCRDAEEAEALPLLGGAKLADHWSSDIHVESRRTHTCVSIVLQRFLHAVHSPKVVSATTYNVTITKCTRQPAINGYEQLGVAKRTRKQATRLGTTLHHLASGQAAIQRWWILRHRCPRTSLSPGPSRRPFLVVPVP